jgi:hypothetical protein
MLAGAIAAIIVVAVLLVAGSRPAEHPATKVGSAPSQRSTAGTTEARGTKPRTVKVTTHAATDAGGTGSGAPTTTPDTRTTSSAAVRRSPTKRPSRRPRPSRDASTAGSHSLGFYRRRCEEVDARGALARLVYSRDEAMRLGDEDVVSLGLTVNRRLRPADVLDDGKTLVETEALVVSCRIDAHLEAAASEFDIDDKGWIPRSIYATDTQEWDWFVTPRKPGRHELVIQVRPVVSVTVDGETVTTNVSHATEAALADTERFRVSVTVTETLNQRVTRTIRSATAYLDDLSGLMKALTGAAVAVMAALTAMGLRRRRHREKRGES